MQTTNLGRTGLTVSVAGLGAGGNSRLGLANGGSVREAVRVVHTALDLGINLIDTAIVYGTEEVVGDAIVGRRDGMVVTTKIPLQVTSAGEPGFSGRRIRPRELAGFLEQSLRRLKTDWADVLFLHGVSIEDYAFSRDDLLPELHRLRDAGKCRFIGIAERFLTDTSHRLLSLAATDSAWDVALVGYNMVNHSAESVLSGLKATGVGTLAAFAVRRRLVDWTAAAPLVERLVSAGEIPAGALNLDDPFDFLRECGIASLSEAAYRFARHAAGIDVVLTGTGSVAHLKENIRSIQAGPLPPEVGARIRRIFAGVSSVSGD